MKRFVVFCLGLALIVLTGCSTEVPSHSVGRVKTSSGWNDEILASGWHPCWGYDKMYVVDTAYCTKKEHMEILVGGKVNLKLDITTRSRVVPGTDKESQAMLKKAFETMPSTPEGRINRISAEEMYKTFVQMKVLAIPKQTFQSQPDVTTALASCQKLEEEVCAAIIRASKSTPMEVEEAQITNYDWPDSITKAQERLMAASLAEEEEAAKVRARLKAAEGELKVKEAQKLVAMIEAESIAESIGIIKERLKDSPEYLMWHQVKVMGQAAMGPNNCFILYPYSTDAGQVKQILGNANLAQVLKPDGPQPELKKSVTVIEKIDEFKQLPVADPGEVEK